MLATPTIALAADTPTLIIDSGYGSNTRPRSVTVLNDADSAATVNVGPAGSTGFPLAPGDSLQLALVTDDVLWGEASGGTATLRLIHNMA